MTIGRYIGRYIALLMWRRLRRGLCRRSRLCVGEWHRHCRLRSLQTILGGKLGDLGFCQIAKLRIELCSRMGIIVGDVLDVVAFQLLRSHPAPRQPWVGI